MIVYTIKQDKDDFIPYHLVIEVNSEGDHKILDHLLRCWWGGATGCDIPEKVEPYAREILKNVIATQE